MAENNFGRYLYAAAAVSLAALVAGCGVSRHDAAPVIMNGGAPGGIETAPVAPIAKSPRSPTPSGPGQRIVVRPGQSVGYLALEYKVTKKAIIEANHLTPPEYKIEIGQQLIIPGGEPHPPALAATQEQPSPPPTERASTERASTERTATERTAPERTAALGKSSKVPEVIPLDDPAPAPKKSAEAPAISFPSPAAPAKGKLAPPAAEPATPPPEKEVASAGAEPAAKSGGHLPWPVRGRVLAGYGSIKGGGHNAGINIAAARGAPVHAVESGVVAYAGNEIRGYGNLVLVKHPDGFISAYAHLDSLRVKRGDKVGRGEVIATVGDTGGVSEPQLHFELRRGKKAVDPREFLGSGANAGGGKGTEG